MTTAADFDAIDFIDAFGAQWLLAEMRNPTPAETP